jgi:hypothetical protein
MPTPRVLMSKQQFISNGGAPYGGSDIAQESLWKTTAQLPVDTQFNSRASEKQRSFPYSQSIVQDEIDQDSSHKFTIIRQMYTPIPKSKKPASVLVSDIKFES